MEYSKKASNCKLLLLDGYYTSEWKDIWNNLLKEAQRVYIEAKDNMIMYQYYYDLAVEVPCVQTQYK